MTNVISADLLRYIKFGLLPLDTEVCALFKKNQITQYLDIVDLVHGTIQTIENGRTRGMCVHRHYSKIIFHTHNIGLKAYPSVEDVLSIIKSRDITINFSLVFSDFGIFVMSCSQKPSTIDGIKPVVSHYLDQIYYGTGRGLELNTEIIRLNLNKMMDKLRIIGLNISFTPWNEVNGDFVF